MNVPSKYGLLKVAGWLLIILSVVFLAICIYLSVWVGGLTADMFPGGVNILSLIPIIIGVVSFISWIVKANELFALSDAERNSRVNQQAIERVMRLTEVQVTGGGSSTQPLPTMSDR
jgi:ABC-type multidrug transport system fused ATPase/permease subunit